MFEDLNQVLDFMLATFDKLLVMYFAGGILSVVFCIFIVRKVSRLIDRLR